MFCEERSRLRLDLAACKKGSFTAKGWAAKNGGYFNTIV